MLSPTAGVTASAYWNAIKSGNITHARMTFTGQNIVLEDGDFDLSTGIQVTDILNGDTDLVFGRAVMKQINTTIINSSKLASLQWAGEFKLEFGVEIASVTKWVTVGYFAGEKPKNITTAEVISFTAYDRMKRFEVLADEFSGTLVYPKTVQQIFEALCTHIGVGYDIGDALANIKGRSFSSAPEDFSGRTCRDILAWIAEACGCYARITASGDCKLVWFGDQTGYSVGADEEFSVESSDIMDGITWDEFDQYTWDDADLFTWDEICPYTDTYAVDEVQVRQQNIGIDIDYPYAMGGNVYMIVDNPFLVITNLISDTNDYIKPIYDRLAAFGGYMPMQIDCIGNWLVESGDIITVTVGSRTLSMPIYCRTMTWRGAVEDTYELTGNYQRQAVSSSNVEKIINSHMIQMYVDSNCYTLKSGITIEEAGVTITGAKYLKLLAGAEFEVNAGSVNIKSGSTFDVDATNFKISSTDKKMVCGNWTFDEKGASLSLLYGKKFRIQGVGQVSLDAATGTYLLQTGYYDSNFNLSKLCWSYVIKSSLIDVVTHDAYESANFYITYDGNYDNYWTLSYYHEGLGQHDEKYMIGYYNKPFEKTYVKEICAGVENGNVNELKLALYNSNHKDISIHLCGSNNNDYPDYYGNILCFKPMFEIDPAQPIGSLGDQSNHWYGAYINNITYVSLTQSSSRDIKHDIMPIGDYGSRIDQLAPVSFVYDADANEQRRLGLIYEDTVDILPEICTGREDVKAINYVELIPILLKEIQELRLRVKELEEREDV